MYITNIVERKVGATMKFIIRLFSLVLLWPANVNGQSAESQLDLIMETPYRNFSAWNASTYCSSCDRTGCLAVPTIYYLGGVCYSRKRGSIMYKKILANETAGEAEGICEMTFRDTLCQDKWDFYDECLQRYPFTCDETDSGNFKVSRDWSILENYCIQSEVPVSPYVTPMFEDRIYQNEADCQGETGDSPPIVGMLMNDSSLCQHASIIIAKERVDGSAVYYCDGDKRVTEMFSDSACSKQDSDLSHTEYVVDGCTPGLELYGEKVEIRYATGCETAPKYHCKDFAAADLGTRLSTPLLTSSAGSNAFSGVVVCAALLAVQLLH